MAQLIQTGGGAAGGVTSFTGDGVVLSNSLSTGAVTATLESIAKNLVLAGPSTGSSATPTFRALANADLPNLQGINATSYGVNGNGCIHFDALGYYFTLSAAAISGTTVTYTGTFNPGSFGIAQAISNIVETAGNVVTLTVASGSYGAGQSIILSGLTTGTWLNGQTVTLLTGTTQTSLVFNDPTSHGAQTSHSETGTALVNLTGYSFSIAGFTNAGNNGQFTVTSNTSTTLVVTNASGVNETHAGTAGSYTVDCPTGQFTTDATVGQIVFASKLASGGGVNGTNSTLLIAQGTISSITSATQMVLSQPMTGTTNTNGQICLVWGDDESTALTNAWNATIAAQTTLVLPSVNPQGTGPAVILVQSAQLCTNTLPWGAGGSRLGFGATGGGINATYIVPTPNFNTASAIQSTCFLYSPDGAEFSNFTIFGGGNCSPGAGYATLIGAQIACSNNCYAHDLAFLFWGASATNGLLTGLQFNGQTVARNINVDGFGQTGIKCLMGGTSLGVCSLSQCSSWDTTANNLYITGAGVVATTQCSFGNGNTGVSVNGGGTWYSCQDELGLPGNTVHGGYTNASVSLGYTYLVAGAITGGVGTATCIGSSINNIGDGKVIYLNAATDKLVLQGCSLYLGTASTGFSFILNNGTLTDAGGNTFSIGASQVPYSGTGTYLRSESEQGRADLTGQVAAVAATTLYTPQITGLFRVSAYLKITTAGTSPVLGPVTITYTDGTDSVAQSVVMSMQTQAGAQATSNAGNTTTTVLTGDLIINALTAVAIKYAIALTGTVGSGAYEAHFKCESL